MSFGFGVGDIVLLLKAIKTGYDKYKNAPDAVKEAVRNVNHIYVGITYIQKHYPVDEEAFIKMFDDKAAALLKEILTEMKPTLKELRKLIHKWNKDCDTFALRVRFSWVYTSEMKSLQEEMAGLYESFHKVLNILSFGNSIHAQNQANVEIARREKQRKKDIEAREKHEKDIQKLLHQILDKQGEETISAAALSTDATLWEKLEGDVQATGLSPDQTRTLLNPIKIEIVRTSAHRKPRSIPIHEKTPDKQPAHPLSPPGGLDPKKGSPRTPNRSPSPRPRPEKYSLPTILVVDRTNGVRSIFAQLYLDLVRAWVVNTTDRLLFGHVSSAGTNISTHFSTDIAKVPAWKLPDGNVQEEWLKEISGQRSYFWSEDGPREKETLLNHTRQWKRIGIRKLHFSCYSHILCFDQDTYSILTKMKALALDGIPRIDGKLQWRLPSSRSVTVEPTIHLLGPQGSFNIPVAEVVAGVRSHLKTFLSTQFNWVRTESIGIADGPKRTQFLWIPLDSVGHVMGKSGSQLKFLEEQNECQIFINPYHSPEERKDGKMVSVVGKKNGIETVKKLILVMVHSVAL